LNDVLGERLSDGIVKLFDVEFNEMRGREEVQIATICK
jgi:hypothetical protein